MRPTLVMLTWRGGDRLTRCLRSIEPALTFFSRVILSVTATEDSDDARQAREFAARNVGVEVVCTGRELPTMEHQRFWIEYLQSSGAQPDDWIFWLAYDDEVRSAGISALVDAAGHWPLQRSHAYIGPWAMRHESADQLWAGDPQAALESWTAMSPSRRRMPVMQWIAEQVRQPTYIQMSGSVLPLAAHAELVLRSPVKSGPMRIEMASVLASQATFVEEFPEPVTIVYGRSNSDRASYGADARREDFDLGRRVMRYLVRSPSHTPQAAALVWEAMRTRLPGRSDPQEEWRVRGMVSP